MYPTKVVDRASFDACLDRMYKDYVGFCKRVGPVGDMILLSKVEWLAMLNKLDGKILHTLVTNFNEKELNVMSN